MLARSHKSFQPVVEVGSDSDLEVMKVGIDSVADPGFPMGGHGAVRGHGPLKWVLFAKNVCKNKKNWVP